MDIRRQTVPSLLAPGSLGLEAGRVPQCSRIRFGAELGVGVLPLKSSRALALGWEASGSRIHGALSRWDRGETALCLCTLNHPCSVR